MMNILYWVCFVYLVAMCFGALYRVVSGGFSRCATFGALLGKLLGIVVVIGFLIGIVYFYLY